MPKDHRCARPGCDVELPGYLLACAPDWKALPLELRRSILRAWARRRLHPTDEVAVNTHLGLVIDAINVWGSGRPEIEAR